jgi:soluble lytic murein transglycosylase-like protein
VDSTVAALITQYAPAYGISPGLALALASRESGGNQAAVGAAGEIGVFQLMPATAASLGVDPTDLTQNIIGGLEYLATQIGKFGDLAKGLAAYNWGPAKVQSAVAQGGSNWFSFIPAAVQAYVSDIMAAAGSSPAGNVTAYVASTATSFTDNPYFLPALVGVGILTLIALL